MAKTAKKPKPIKGELVAAKPRINLDVSLSTTDVVAIAVSRAEKQLLTQRKHLTSVYNNSEKLLETETENFRKAVEEYGQELAKPAVRDFKSVLNDHGSNLEISVEIVYGEDEVEESDTDGLSPNDKIVNITIGFSDKRCDELTACTIKGKLSKELLEAARQLDLRRQNLGIVAEQIADCTIQLGNLSSLEREQRAALAEAQLSKTAEGRAILDKLTSGPTELLRLTSG